MLLLLVLLSVLLLVPVLVPLLPLVRMPLLVLGVVGRWVVSVLLLAQCLLPPHARSVHGPPRQVQQLPLPLGQLRFAMALLKAERWAMTRASSRRRRSPEAVALRQRRWELGPVLLLMQGLVAELRPVIRNYLNILLVWVRGSNVHLRDFLLTRTLALLLLYVNLILRTAMGSSLLEACRFHPLAMGSSLFGRYRVLNIMEAMVLSGMVFFLPFVSVRLWITALLQEKMYQFLRIPMSSTPRRQFQFLQLLNTDFLDNRCRFLQLLWSAALRRSFWSLDISLVMFLGNMYWSLHFAKVMLVCNMHRALHFVIVMLVCNMYRALHFAKVMLLCNQYWVQDLLTGLFPLLLGQFLQLLVGVKLSMEFLLLRISAMVFLVSMLNMYQLQIFVVLPTLGWMSRFLCYVVVIRSISNFLRYVTNDVNSFRNTIMDYLYISCTLQHSEFLAAAHGLVVL